METSSSPISIPTKQHGSSAVRNRQDANEDPAVGSAAKSPAQSELQRAEVAVRKDRELPGNRPLERRDTTDSWVSGFAQRRSNTGWSLDGASVITDATEPPSPVTASFQDEASYLDAANYASSPRQSNLMSHSLALQNCPPSTPPSLSFSDTLRFRLYRHASSLDSASPPRHRRVEEMASRRGSGGRSTALGGAGTGQALPFRTRPSQAGPSVDGSNTRDTNDLVQSDHETGSATVNTPESSDSAIEDPGQLQREHTDVARQEDDVVESCPGSARIETSPSLSIHNEMVSPDKPDDSIIQDVCEKVIKHAFGLEMEDLAAAGVVSAAYESVRYCLDELSHVALSIRPGDADLLICESTRETAGFDGIPFGGQAASSDSGARGGESGRASGNGGGAQKRPNGGHGNDGAGGQGTGDGKRRKVSGGVQASLQPLESQFSCPFRKRNPVKFNIRDHQSCALQPFPTLSLLKRHVKNFHKRKPVSFACPRCKQGMGTQKALNDHLAVDRDQICSVQQAHHTGDPEDGITAQVEELLNERKAEVKIDTWQSLWKTLFPEDTMIPEPDFVPPIELDEVYAEFKTEYCLDKLRQGVQGGLSDHDRPEEWMAIFQRHIDLVFGICRAKTDGMTPRPRRSRAQTPRDTASLHTTSNGVNLGRLAVMDRSNETGEPHGNISPSSSADCADGNRSLFVVPHMQSHVGVPYAQSKPVTGHTGGGVEDDVMTGFVGPAPGVTVPVPDPDQTRITSPVTVPPQVYFHGGFLGPGHGHAQGQTIVGGQYRVLSRPDSAINLHGTYAAQPCPAQAVYPCVPGGGFPESHHPGPSFCPQNGYENVNLNPGSGMHGGFGHPGRLPRRPVPVPGQTSPAVDAGLGPSVDFFQGRLMDNGNGGFENLPPQH